MLFEHEIVSGHLMMYNITDKILEDILASKIESGLVVVYCPHTTAAITINEGCDPEVVKDILRGLEVISPPRPAYTHLEGNSHAHLKSSLIGASETILVHQGKPILGTYQAVFFCEFDGPRKRKYYVKVISQS
jgi:secondary thiamine-phosphate synthase enzyme